MQAGSLRYTYRPGRWPGSPVNARAYKFGSSSVAPVKSAAGLIPAQREPDVFLADSTKRFCFAPSDT
jgi:hypothetical protein